MLAMVITFPSVLESDISADVRQVSKCRSLLWRIISLWTSFSSESHFITFCIVITHCCIRILLLQVVPLARKRTYNAEKCGFFFHHVEKCGLEYIAVVFWLIDLENIRLFRQTPHIPSL